MTRSLPLAALLTALFAALAPAALADVGPGAVVVASGKDPSSMDFGFVKKGTKTSTRPVTVQNQGDAPLHISKVAFGGKHPKEWFFGANTCAGATVAPGATCTINVGFAPNGPDLRAAQLVIQDDAPDSPQVVTLIGNGLTKFEGVILNQSTVTLKGKALSLSLSCPASVSQFCAGHAGVFARVRIGDDTKPTFHSLGGKGDYKITKGATKTVKLTLTAAYASVLRGQHPGRIRITFNTHDRGGQRAIVVRQVGLRV